MAQAEPQPQIAGQLVLLQLSQSEKLSLHPPVVGAVSPMSEGVHVHPLVQQVEQAQQPMAAVVEMVPAEHLKLVVSEKAAQHYPSWELQQFMEPVVAAAGMTVQADLAAAELQTAVVEMAVVTLPQLQVALVLQTPAAVAAAVAQEMLQVEPVAMVSRLSPLIS